MPDELRPPRNVGIIMDGNRRWAGSRGASRASGHQEGLVATKRIVGHAADIGVRYLWLYTFSTENWKRAEEEVGFLMGLIRKHLRGEFDFYREHRIRVRFAGNLEGLPTDIRDELGATMDDTRSFDRLDVILALNYGGRDEIVRSIRRWLRLDGCVEELTEAKLAAHLDNPDIPDPDLIIRTAGEFRMSNFLLWQAAYSELYFSSKLWPDFSPADFDDAIRDFAARSRTYGGPA